MIKELQLLGMSRNEAIVYWSLVKTGPCKAAALIDDTGFHRNIVYSALENLIYKGYVTKVSVRGVWRYQIADPGVLLSNLKRHEEIANNIIQEISAFSRNATRLIKVHEGVDSYRRYWLTTFERVPDGTIDYVAGGYLDPWSDYLGQPFLDKFWKLCIEKKIEFRQLYFGITDAEIKQLRDTPIAFEARNWKDAVPRQFIGNFNVIHDSVILHTVQEPPRIIEIIDDAIVPTFQNYFDIMWNQAEPIDLAKQLRK